MLIVLKFNPGGVINEPGKSKPTALSSRTHSHELQSARLLVIQDRVVTGPSASPHFLRILNEDTDTCSSSRWYLFIIALPAGF